MPSITSMGGRPARSTRWRPWPPPVGAARMSSSCATRMGAVCPARSAAGGARAARERPGEHGAGRVPAVRRGERVRAQGGDPCERGHGPPPHLRAHPPGDRRERAPRRDQRPVRPGQRALQGRGDGARPQQGQPGGSGDPVAAEIPRARGVPVRGRGGFVRTAGAEDAEPASPRVHPQGASGDGRKGPAGRDRRGGQHPLGGGRPGRTHRGGGQRAGARAGPGAAQGARAFLPRDPPGAPGGLQGAGPERGCRDGRQSAGADPIDGWLPDVGDRRGVRERRGGLLAGAGRQPGIRPAAEPRGSAVMSAGRARRIAVIPGDGIGREVIAEAVRVLSAVDRRYELGLEVEEGLAGGAAIDAEGHPIPEKTLALCRRSDAILLGACGGPKWDSLPRARRPEQALFTLRKTFGLYANLRPAVVSSPPLTAAPLRREGAEGTDILIVRELTGGLYFGAQSRTGRGQEAAAMETLPYSAAEARRVVRKACEIARGPPPHKVTPVDKANG